VAHDTPVHPTTPVAHHHHHAHAATPTTPEPVGSSATEADDDDLLAPGSIPREGSATTP